MFISTICAGAIASVAAVFFAVRRYYNLVNESSKLEKSRHLHDSNKPINIDTLEEMKAKNKCRQLTPEVLTSSIFLPANKVKILEHMGGKESAYVGEYDSTKVRLYLLGNEISKSELFLS